MKINFGGLLLIIFCIYNCVFVPIISAIMQRKAGPKQPPPAGRIITRSALWCLALAVVALLFAKVNRVPVFGSGQVDLRTSLAAFAFLAIALIYDRVEWKFTSPLRKTRISYILPRTPKERMSWALVSLVAAFGEEIFYRAVLFGLLLQLTGNYWISGAISAVLFALSHLTQGIISAVGVFFMGLGLQWLVYISGGLYVAIAVHFAHNFVNGIVYGAMADNLQQPAVAEQEQALISDL